MPIETVQQSIHIRRKKNAVVFDNLERLWRLQHEAKSHQDILDGLHPWNAPITLKFDNFLPIVLFLAGIFCALLILISPTSIYLQLGFVAGAVCSCSCAFAAKDSAYFCISGSLFLGIGA